MSFTLRSYRGFPVRCDVTNNSGTCIMRPLSTPKLKYTTDCYQVVQSHDVIKIKATLPSKPNPTSAICYLLSTVCLTGYREKCLKVSEAEPCPVTPSARLGLGPAG